jgi:hypothetical protein
MHNRRERNAMTRKTLRPIRWCSIHLFAGAAALALAAAPVHAVGTRQFVLDTLKSFEGGDLTGVAVASDGTVRAGLTLGNLPIPDASNVWGSVVLGDGSVLLGTGTGGRIYKVKGGNVSIAAETDAMAVSALALAFNGDVVAGSFPDGKLFRSAPGKLDGSKLKPWVELDKTEDIWSLAYDAKNRALYAATGPDGKLYRITDNGKAEVYFDSDEAHLVSVAVAPDGTVYAGSNGKALLYRLTGPGRAHVVHDFDADDVKAIAVARSGAVYAVANTYKGATKGLRAKKSGGGLGTAPQPKSNPKPGKGKLMRFDKTGVAELMLDDSDTHFVTLALDEKGTPYVGSGHEGKVYTVDANHVVQLVADTEERQIGAMSMVAGKRFVATTDPVVYHEITGRGGSDAVWTSKVLDSGLRAHFGLLEWRGSGTVELQTRSGNTEKPDDSWSAWSTAIVRPGKIQSPPARFLQIRSRWSRDPAAVLEEVKASFVTDNARALLTEVKVGSSKTDSGSKKVPESGGPLDKASEKLKISWKVDNPDSDKLRYRLFYRPLASKNWFAILDSDEQLTKTSYQWDTTGLPEGRYRIRVDVTDELSNPPGQVSSHRLESRTVLVDNTAPVLGRLAFQGNRLQGNATDGVGPIARFEFAMVGSKDWRPLHPSDRVFDQPIESFDADLSGRAIVSNAPSRGGSPTPR